MEVEERVLVSGEPEESRSIVPDVDVTRPPQETPIRPPGVSTPAEPVSVETSDEPVRPSHSARQQSDSKAAFAILLDGQSNDGDNFDMEATTTLDKLFDSVGDCLTVDTATRLTHLTLPESIQQQLDNWADRNTLGQLDDSERSQYEATLRALNFVAVLQAKARRIVATPQL